MASNISKRRLERKTTVATGTREKKLMREKESERVKGERMGNCVSSECSAASFSAILFN